MHSATDHSPPQRARLMDSERVPVIASFPPPRAALVRHSPHVRVRQRIYELPSACHRNQWPECLVPDIGVPPMCLTTTPTINDCGGDRCALPHSVLVIWRTSAARPSRARPAAPNQSLFFSGLKPASDLALLRHHANTGEGVKKAGAVGTVIQEKVRGNDERHLGRPRAPHFLVTPGGTAFPGPHGATGPVPVLNQAGNRTGTAFTGGSGGANGQVATSSIRHPTALGRPAAGARGTGQRGRAGAGAVRDTAQPAQTAPATEKKRCQAPLY